MKINIMIIFFLASPLIVLSQDTLSIPPLKHEIYLEKSKNQKTVGLVMLGGGSAMFLIGLAIYSEQGFNTGNEVYILAGVGVVSTIASIPLFITSGKNARKAATISLGHHSLLIPNQPSTFLHFQPALSLKIAFTK